MRTKVGVLFSHGVKFINKRGAEFLVLCNLCFRSTQALFCSDRRYICNDGSKCVQSEQTRFRNWLLDLSLTFHQKH